MYLNVLIVDDEVLSRNHLRSLIQWDQHDLAICGEADNGMNAVHRIKELEPDIIIMDISMPQMNGVELAKYVSQNHKQIKMIVVSSFDTYDFVRETLNSGAIDYLLKHRITGADLLSVLEKIKKQFRSETLLEEVQQSSIKKWQRIGPTVSQNYLNDLILGASPDVETISKHFEEMEFGAQHSVFKLILMQIINYDLLCTRFSETEFNLHNRSIVELCQQAIGDYIKGCTAYVEKGSFALLISFGEIRSERDMNQHADILLRRIEKSLHMFMNARAVFRQSTIFHQMNEVYGNYKRLRTALDELIGSSSSDISANAVHEQILTISIREEKNLLSMIEVGNQEELNRILNQIFRKLDDTDYHSRQRMLTELLHIAAKTGRKAGLDTDWIYQYMAGFVQSTKSYEDLKNYIQHVYEKIINEISDQSVAYSNYVAQTVQIIKELYKEGVSLEVCAERIGITPSYLSRLFKEETGKNYTEYINAYRIEISKRLIEENDHRIKEMYERVGFNSYSYFIKVFKEIVGVTPHAYARQNVKCRNESSRNMK